MNFTFLDNENVPECGDDSVQLVYGENDNEIKARHENLMSLRKILQKYKINYCLLFGTLLGSYREKDFILNDGDDDIYIDPKDIKKLNKDFISDIKAEGFVFTRRWMDMLISISRNGRYIDLCFIRQKNKDICCGFGQQYSAKYFNEPFKQGVLHGETYPVFNNTKGFLRACYGEDFMIPSNSGFYNLDVKYILEYYYLTRTMETPEPYYLLNNLVYHEFQNEVEHAIELWPKSIGAQYNISKRETTRTKIAKNNIHFSVGEPQHDVLSHCVDNVIKDFSHLLSKGKRCCIHLRLGDALNPFFWKNEEHDWSYAPFKEQVVYQHVKDSVPKDYAIDIIYCSSAGGSPITEDIIESSNQYVKNLTDLLKKDYQNINCFDNSHPDIDFCRAVRSDIFIKGFGGFTNLIKSHRNFRKLKTICIRGESLDPNR